MGKIMEDKKKEKRKNVPDDIPIIWVNIVKN